MRIDEQALRDFSDAYEAAFSERLPDAEASLLLAQLAEFYLRVAEMVEDFEDPIDACAPTQRSSPGESRPPTGRPASQVGYGSV